MLKLSQPNSNIYTSDSQNKVDNPKATLEVLEWLEGHWRGPAFDGIGEEIWGPAFGSSMMGVFKQIVDDSVKFYEILTISEENDSLILRIKHFGQDLKGWEEKDDSMEFNLLKVSDSSVYFDGLTFEKINKNKINIYVLLGDEGNRKEVVFNYSRVSTG